MFDTRRAGGGETTTGAGVEIGISGKVAWLGEDVMPFRVSVVVEDRKREENEKENLEMSIRLKIPHETTIKIIITPTTASPLDTKRIVVLSACESVSGGVVGVSGMCGLILERRWFIKEIDK